MANAFATYRQQNGIAPLDNAGDPVVVDWIKQAAASTGADPAALLATSLMESGARRGRVGDQGTSFGPFQFHIGGALGSHSPQWANSYAAVLNRAQQFARYGVHGGAGAAAVQRPADRANYATGVNDLLSRANSILGRTPSGAPAPGSAPRTAATPPARLGYDPQATLDFVNALLGDSSIEYLAQLGEKLGAQRAPGGQSAGPPPSTPGGSQPSAPLQPGGGWAGSQHLASSLAQIGINDGLKIISEKRNRKMTASGGISDHWVGTKNGFAYDISNGSAPTPQMDKAAAQIAARLGVPNWKGGVLNVNRGGYRYQVLYRTNVGGNHYNHVHVGVRKI